MKHWPLGSRVALWTAILLTVELIIFGVASGWVIYQEQLEAFREIKGQPFSPIVIRKEAAELIVDLASAYATVLPIAVLVAAFGVWWITRKALQPLHNVAAAGRPKSLLRSTRSGLGLSICREIVLAHGGQIWLERPRPGWTAFVFTLPAAQDERDRAEDQKLAPGPKGDRSDGTLKQSASDTPPPAWWRIHAYSEAASPDPVLLPTRP